ncbi:hypothetical protein [Nakamurella lactea]|uniref:hypothetical protein n=1 Tax=Nakamurella lactea TaxID=459515 RepID=UPI0012B63993|nr:hypothetical protein [Nakamurella lactea]
MTQGPEADGVVLKLSPSEARTVVSALRQYEPYWPADDGPPREHLAALSEEIMALLARLRSSETEAGLTATGPLAVQDSE